MYDRGTYVYHIYIRALSDFDGVFFGTKSINNK